MKPNDLYKLTPISISNDPYRIKDQVPEIDFYRLKPDDIPELSIRYYAQTCYDGERVWYLYSVWLRDTPIMICQEAGRGGSDYQNKFITNWVAYNELVSLLISQYEKSDAEMMAMCDPNEEIADLTEFYGDSLSQYYDAALKPTYAVGDIVMVNVPVDHIRDWKNKITTRVRIKRVNHFNPSGTYWGMQLDRRWGDGELSRTMIVDVGHGGVGATFTDADVVGLADK